MHMKPIFSLFRDGASTPGVWKARPRHWIAAFVLAATWWLSGASAFATVVIAPNDLPNESDLSGDEVPASETYGDTSNLFPFFPGAGNALEYQQVYDASQFSAFAPGGEDITEISFRVGIEAPTRADMGAFAATIPLIQITLSTTGNGASNLSTTFANNTGADAVTVYGVPSVGSPLALASSGATTTGTTAPAPFDITVVLTTPFHYDPSKGNLLLQVDNYEGATSPTGVQLDGTDTGESTASVFNFGDATAATATDGDPEGLVTEFSTGLVPEPGAAPLLLAALPVLTVLLIRRRRTDSAHDL
jgi:hypothetical protein